MTQQYPALIPVFLYTMLFYNNTKAETPADIDCVLLSETSYSVNDSSLFPESTNSRYDTTLTETVGYIRYNINYPVSRNHNKSSTSTYNQFSDFPIGTIDQVLPLMLLNYSATVQENGRVVLSWTTTSEHNCAYFLLERSWDGQSYEEIDKIVTQGTTSTTQLYNFIDKDALEGTNYYRLSQFDKDGTSRLMGLKMAKINFKRAAWRMHPNPAFNECILSLPWASAGHQKISIFDHAGNLVLQKTLPVINGKINFKFDNHPAAGIYHLKLGNYGTQTLLIK